MIEVSAGIGLFITHAAGVPLGFDASLARSPDARIPLAVETLLWDEGARATGDQAFGLHAAEKIRPGIFDVLDYVVRTAPTLRESLRRLARYNRLVHDAAIFTLHEGPAVVRVEHALRAGAVQSRHAAEFTLASLLVFGSQICGAPLLPLAVEFRHPAPPDLREHARLFGRTPRFSAEVNAVEFDAATLDQPSPTADPALSRLVERNAEALLALRPAPAVTQEERVRRLLPALLGEGQATLAHTAQRLKMSERSLQRRLAGEGLTFDALLEELRRDLSLRYLQDPKVAIAEVAYLVGYSEPSAFHRAFKRWTGRTPAEARGAA